MKLVVGLGNPGPKYAGTRHNVGFDVVDRLARRWRVDLSAEKFHAWFAVTDVGEERVGLMKPTTFMNRSGQAVAAATRFYQLSPADLMVVVDDLALPPGKIRIRSEGSAGSHNGLTDIIERLGRQDWPRLRIGIGPAEGIGAQYVLSRFAEDERATMEEALDRAADAVECWLKEGVATAMNRYNG
ncbi:MAG: aminoacyl-tRNA hydrolase [Phycisphaerae bacterium]|nr:MAG: aminoacyl-tRNA hydrolase [Planctomycetota bacterium]KAB2936793.1 MAG: aminoacyl-tRNA hydrolase [Phycisphaerae bacterium]MBE7455802.1 aminoacyl-tRNA hydrolase [Planctomycetia bacterium]MCK6463437.1 aminoacyl-tRNA hydrolase [Phycisphaerae bacterium]MCL4717059.1 aminoacyl-tRNA hydrolase [Phycisphaerae bacterium]